MAYPIVQFEPALAGINDILRGLLRLFRKHIADYNRVNIDPIDYTPRHSAFGVSDSQFMTPRRYGRHWPRFRHLQQCASLDKPEQKASGTPGCSRKWRTLNLSVQPNENLIRHAMCEYMSDMT
jgi:hypothetical protein